MLVALAAAPSALAHTVFTNFFIDGVSQGDGVAIRMNTNLVEASNPIASLESNDLACNVGGSKGVSRVAPIQDGSTLTFEIRAWPDDASKERLDRGHKGPCAVYLKKVDSAINDQGTCHGDGWFKIFDHGYDKDADAWCTDKIIDNDGKLSVVLPKGLESGYYLARPEILALHKALENDPQFYTGCAQLFLEGGGNLGPAETVSIPGYVKYGQESTNWNIYYGTKPEDYPLPGPQIAKLVSKSASANAGETSQTEGLKPAGCIVENANWCGKEVPDYSDEKGCWASTENCWDQADVCFKSAGPTGHKGCTTMQEKCQAQSDLCKSGDFNGPKNKGKVLTPKPAAVDVGELLATEGGGAPVVDTPKTEATQPKPTSAAAPAKTSAFETVAAPSKTPVADVEKPVPEAEYPTVTSKPTVKVPASEAGPAPTAPVCPEGYKCVTVYETVVKTEVVYSTVYNDYRRRSVQNRRRV
ncbi:lytic polysaccharide monooxygenase [Aaosphaeria arxii CBS 175.79]|uniref:AA9 family lytic polysaccharide monooxygenase n=1 Tax=Aaosphaeria arxii CBS 175.79 TaxID=1450172 RepID=A0A6A5XA35_9PLEO|nr:lytic polysaccharide monooxygenase [Aaosphaeria arxii CBS 175.79]KAF2009915.1 lytic polysaccharide monooxygenase [Aaosphaeria arxii CBS 175.79]